MLALIAIMPVYLSYHFGNGIFLAVWHIVVHNRVNIDDDTISEMLYGIKPFLFFVPPTKLL